MCDHSVDVTWVVTASSAGRTIIHRRWKRIHTVHDSILQRYSLTRSEKHSLKNDYRFQLDIGHYDQINARSKMCFDDQYKIDLITCGPSQIDFHTSNNSRKGL